VCDVLLEIVEYLDLRSIENLRATCQLARARLDGEGSRRVRNTLAPYFPGKVYLFGKYLRKAEAIISGSTVLHTLTHKRTWTPGDLDILVSPTKSKYMEELLITCGYVLTLPEHREGQPGFGHTVSKYGDLWQYIPYLHPMLHTKIDLCVGSSKFPSPIQQLLTYHSTAVMNFISGWRVVSLFPDLTFNCQNVRNDFARRHLKAEAAMRKYAERGFPMVQVPRKLQKDFIMPEEIFQALNGIAGVIEVVKLRDLGGSENIGDGFSLLFQLKQDVDACVQRAAEIWLEREEAAPVQVDGDAYLSDFFPSLASEPLEKRLNADHLERLFMPSAWTSKILFGRREVD
jgi:hypothetical protein